MGHVTQPRSDDTTARAGDIAWRRREEPEAVVPSRRRQAEPLSIGGHEYAELRDIARATGPLRIT